MKFAFTVAFICIDDVAIPYIIMSYDHCLLKYPMDLRMEIHIQDEIKKKKCLYL